MPAPPTGGNAGEGTVQGIQPGMRDPRPPSAASYGQAAVPTTTGSSDRFRAEPATATSIRRRFQRGSLGEAFELNEGTAVACAGAGPPATAALPRGRSGARLDMKASTVAGVGGNPCTTK